MVSTYQVNAISTTREEVMLERSWSEVSVYDVTWLKRSKTIFVMCSQRPIRGVELFARWRVKLLGVVLMERDCSDSPNSFFISIFFYVWP